MIHNTNGIVLNRFKYSDSKVIARIYTEDFGLQAYMFFGAASKKGRMQINLLQPFTPLSMEVYHKESVELQKTKEISLLFPLNTLGFDVIKNTIALFLSEFILKVIKENETDKDLFTYLINSVKSLDSNEEGVNNFYLIFLFKLTQHLGIQPQNNYSESKRIFDLQAAKFIIGKPAHELYLDEELSLSFFDLFGKTIEQSHLLKIDTHIRKVMLDTLINYYNFHLDRPGSLKSLKVLKEIFA